jgi:hypothetical protein
MNRRNFKTESRSAIFNVIFVVLLAALIGVPLYLGLWQLAVYPAVIGGLVLFWMFLEYKARTDPNDPLGFLDHTHAMWFGFLFGIPSMLFLAGWTIYLALGRDPILSRSAPVIGGLVLCLLILSGPLSELFAKQRARKRRSRKSRKGTKGDRKSWLRWIAPVFSPYLKLEEKLTTGIARGGESDGQETQFPETVFHFRSVVLNVIVLAIRGYVEEPNLGITYLQMLWVNTSLVGWLIYWKRSASAIPIIEPGHVLGVILFGFIGGIGMSALTSTIIDALVTTRFSGHNVFEAFEFLGASTAIFLAFFGVGWLERRISGSNGWLTWLALHGCVFAFLGLVWSGLGLISSLLE